MKKRLLALLRKSSIARRLMGVMALILLLLLLWCVTVIMTTIRSDRLLLRTANTQIAYELVGSVDAAISSLEAITKFPITLEANGQSQVFQYLRKRSLVDERDFILNSGVRAEIQGQMGGYASLSMLCIGDLEGRIVYCAPSRGSTLWYTQSVDMNGEMMRAVMAARGRLTLFSMEECSLSDYAVCRTGVWGARAILNNGPFQPVGMLICLMDLSDCLSCFQLNRTFETQRMAVYGPDGSLLLSEGGLHVMLSPEKADTVYETFVHTDDMLSCLTYRSASGTMAVITTPVWELVLHYLKVSWHLPVLMLVLAAILLCTAYLLIKSILDPMDRLKNACNSLSSLSGRLHVPDDGGDEMHEVIESFNAMSVRIARLGEESHEKDRQRAQIEMQMLRSQVNPHFLYNTLETMRAHALDVHNSELAEMAGLLGKTLRYGLSEHETVSVRREMRNLMDYIALQSLHYQSRITAHVSMEPEILDCIILKLLLQPLVENAIVHGVGPCERGGSVDLMGYCDGDVLVFAVSDDGAGMDAQKLALLTGYIRGENDAFSSIGLRNAHRRIELYYGEGYGLNIASQEGAGTVVTVRVPAVRHGEGEAAHENPDCGR